MKRGLAIWILLAVMVVGALIRSYALADRSLWFDESFSARLIQFPFSEMIARDAADVHPPLYYIFLKSWAFVFGQSVFALRMFSVAIAALAVAAMYLFVSYGWKSRAVGLFAAILLALSAWQIPFAWEARMYTMGTLFVLLSSWALLHAIRQKKQSYWWWLAYGVLAAASIYTHYYALFSLAAQAVFVAGLLLIQTRGRVGELFHSKVLWNGLLAAGITVLLFSPWVSVFLRQNAQVQAQFWIPAPNIWSIPDILYKMYFPTINSPVHEGWTGVVSVLPLIFSLLIIAWTLFVPYIRRPKLFEEDFFVGDAAWLTALSAVVPFLLSLGLSLTGRSLFSERYFVFAHIFLLAALAVWVSLLKPIWLRWVIGVVVSIGFISAYMWHWQELDIKHKPGLHAAVSYVYTNKKADEPVLVSSSFIYFAANHYAQDEFNSQAKLFTESTEIVHFAGGPIVAPDDFMRLADLNNPGIRTVWVIDTTGFGSSATILPKEWKKNDSKTFQEVYGYQGEIMAARYSR